MAQVEPAVSQTALAVAPCPPPRLVFWEVTKGCNLRCIHCRANPTELASPLDLPTREALAMMDGIAAVARPILVLSGGEPLFRADIFDLASYAAQCGMRVALATNGTLVSRDVAGKIVGAGIRRVSISLDGADAATHDAFRGMPGAFEAALKGLRNLKELGMSVQINMTIARHNAHQLPQVLELAKSLGADALHTFLLVPVGCGAELAPDTMVPARDYEEILNWFYDRAKEGEIELKATCAPHYFRVVRQRRAAERRASAAPSAPPRPQSDPRAIGPTEMTAPGTTGISLKADPLHARCEVDGVHAMTRGCLAGSGVCFISHEGEVYPCGYLPVLAGDLRKQSFAEIWNHSMVFRLLRNPANLKGKCGRCEFRNLCLGCRARAYAATGDFLSEEPFCAYQPRNEKLNSRVASRSR